MENYHVRGRDLHDGAGHRVVLRGVNKMSVFDDADPEGDISFPEIRQTGANSVRIVWARARKLFDDAPPVPTSVATLDALVTKAKENRLIPMIELHDATGAWDLLPDLVDYWVRPEVLSLIEKHREYLLVNIGNEVGDDQVTSAQFVSGYTTAVERMRAAGIHTPLVIDASSWGKDLEMLNATAPALLAADPDRNLLFSAHLYWPLSCGADADFIRTQLEAAVALDYPLIVGEFSQFGGTPCPWDPAASICGPDGEIDYRTILAECHRHEIGWYAWEWGPGNDFNDALCAVMDMTPDRLRANLKPGWAEEVAISSPHGIMQTAVTPPTM